MQTSKPTLEKSLHLRISTQFEEKLAHIAQANGLKTSSLARHILIRHLQEFSPSTPAWLRWDGYDTIASRDRNIEEEVVVLCRVDAKHETSSRELFLEYAGASHKEAVERKEGNSYLSRWSTKRAQELMFRKSVWNPMICKSGGMLNLSGSEGMYLIKFLWDWLMGTFLRTILAYLCIAISSRMIIFSAESANLCNRGIS
jgi:hypothetical protein